MKQIVEQLLADRRMKLMDQVAGGIREAAAKSQKQELSMPPATESAGRRQSVLCHS